MYPRWLQLTPLTECPTKRFAHPSPSPKNSQAIASKCQYSRISLLKYQRRRSPLGTALKIKTGIALFGLD